METTLTQPLASRSPADQEAPVEAFRFDAPQVKFAAGSGKAQSKSVELVARTGDPIEHWYWGRIVHDMAGMKTKPVVAMDWCHSTELIGKLDQFDTDSGDLVTRGSVESLEAGDLADQIIRRSDRGIPYEASIFFDPWDLVLEYLPEGMFTMVNNRQIEGPAVIAREWTLRRVALCPSGADGGSEARFNSAAPSGAKFAINWKGSPVTKSTTAPGAAAPTQLATTPAGSAAAPAGSAAPAATPAIPPATAAALQTTPTEAAADATGKPADGTKSEFEQRFERFTAEFGAEAGTEYLRAGLSYEAALRADLEKTKLALKTAQADNQAAQQKLAAVNLGEASAVDVGVTRGGTAGEGGGSHSFGSCFKSAQGRLKK